MQPIQFVWVSVNYWSILFNYCSLVLWSHNDCAKCIHVRGKKESALIQECILTTLQSTDPCVYLLMYTCIWFLLHCSFILTSSSWENVLVSQFSLQHVCTCICILSTTISTWAIQLVPSVRSFHCMWQGQQKWAKLGTWNLAIFSTLVHHN